MKSGILLRYLHEIQGIFPLEIDVSRYLQKVTLPPVSFLKTIAPPKSRGMFLIKAVDDTLQPIFYTSKLPEIRIMMNSCKKFNRNKVVFIYSPISGLHCKPF